MRWSIKRRRSISELDDEGLRPRLPTRIRSIFHLAFSGMGRNGWVFDLGVGVSDMQVISGTRRAIKEMADGTIRVQIDIDPTCRAAFWSLFPSIDMPVAIAPLVADFERRAPDNTATGNNVAKGGPLAQWAAMRCAEYSFQEFLWDMEGADRVPTEDEAIEIIYAVCNITSRAELDNNAEAKRLFDERIRKPYAEWQRKRCAA